MRSKKLFQIIGGAMLIMAAAFVAVQVSACKPAEAKQTSSNEPTETVQTSFSEPAEDGLVSGFVKAKGKVLYDGAGESLQLRGVNLGNYFVQEFWMGPTLASSEVRCQKELEEILKERFGEEKAAVLLDTYLDNYLTEKDFDRIAGLGFNCVRVPFWYGTLTDEEGKLHEDAFRRLDWITEEAGKRGLYVILDMHGAYGSQNGSDHSGIDGGDDKKAASEFFFGEQAEKNQELYYRLWEEIAKHYRDNPVIVGYDLLNEPFCTYRYNSGMSNREFHALLFPVYDTAYQRIRSIDPNHLIIFEAVWDVFDLPDPAQYGWQNAMYEYHQYEYSNYWNENGAQIKGLEKKVHGIRQKSYDVPSYLGEFTLFNNMDAWAEGLAYLDAEGIHWTFWSYKCMTDNDNWGLLRLSVPKADPANDSYETILEKWSQLQEAEENTDLIEVIQKHLAY